MNGSKKFTDPEFIKAWRTMEQFKPYIHPKQEERWSVNVKVINQEMTPEQTAQYIQRIHEKNAYIKQMIP